jgi:hypothetical protein
MNPANNGAIRFPDGHFMLYGESGSGKTTFWATLIKYFHQNFNEPSLVFAFDPWDKMTPFLELGEKRVPNTDKFYADLGLEVTDVMDDQGSLIVRVEYYADPEPQHPVAMAQFERRMMGFEKECRNWASVCIDSMTFFQRASFVKWKTLNPFTDEQATKQHTNISWYGGVAEDAANTIMSRAAWWKTNVGVICHVDEGKDEFADFGVLRSVALAGKMSKRGPVGFGEVYRMRVVQAKGKDGEYKRELQTRSDSQWVANSLVAKAPNPSEPLYEALWTNWNKGR